MINKYHLIILFVAGIKEFPTFNYSTSSSHDDIINAIFVNPIFRSEFTIDIILRAIFGSVGFFVLSF